MQSGNTINQTISAQNEQQPPASPAGVSASFASSRALQQELDAENRRILTWLGGATALLIASIIAAFFAFSGMVSVATGLATLAFYVCAGLLTASLIVLSRRTWGTP